MDIVGQVKNSQQTIIGHINNVQEINGTLDVMSAVNYNGVVLYNKEQTLTDAQKTQARTNIGASSYEKPSVGIPKTDLASDVQASLDKADTALQTHQDISGKVNEDVGTTSSVMTSVRNSGSDIKLMYNRNYGATWNYIFIENSGITLKEDGPGNRSELKIGSGRVTVDKDPQTDMSVATKKYVDTKSAGKESSSNKVTSLSSSSTDTEYPSAKCVYDLVGDIELAINTIRGVS